MGNYHGPSLSCLYRTSNGIINHKKWINAEEQHGVSKLKKKLVFSVGQTGG